uniref:Gag protein n=1 Tax=Ditylenchus dipsaci TaxID=166011 RepID=A0A915EBH2_9BILA
MSDFDPVHFSNVELRAHATLLTQLRSFEQAIARDSREMTELVDTTRKEFATLATWIENVNTETKQKEKLQNLPPTTGRVLSGDPFLAAATNISKYDGSPTKPFGQWIEQFRDTLGLLTALTENQKLNRLKFCLAGRAREEFGKIAATTLEEAIIALKDVFENTNQKTVARQGLSICRQAPGEKVFHFYNRLNTIARAALVGEDEASIQKRLLEEFWTGYSLIFSLR